MGGRQAVSVAEFLHELAHIRDTQSIDMVGEVSSMTFFRGQADSSWRLWPALFREGMHVEEQNLVRAALRISPAQFEGLSDFQRLARMQHFGLRTRLLDTTTNPLVALYFACVSHPNLDGEVFIFPNLPTFSEENYMVQVLTHFVFRSHWQSFNVETFAQEVKPKFPPGIVLSDTMEKEVTRILTFPQLAVIPNNTNPRLMSQSGAFLVCGMQLDVKKERRASGKTYWEFLPAPLDSAIGLYKDRDVEGGELKIRIPHEAKKKILEQLDLVDVNQLRLFPDPEQAMRYLNQRFAGHAKKRAEGIALTQPQIEER